MDAAQSLATQLEISIGTNPQKRKYSRTAITWPRKRATQACHTCRFRRTKCDNTRPACTSCVRLGAECTYQDKDPSTFDAASLAILKRLDDLESIIQTGFNNEPSPSVHSHGIFSSPSITQDHSSSPMISQDNQWKLRFINLESVLEWPVFDRHNFHQRIHLLNPPNHSKPAPVPPISIEIDPQETESLIRTFFDYVNIFNPILEEEDIQECSNAACFNGIGWDAKSCLLLLIYAHGLTARPFFNKEPHVSPAGDFHQSEQFQRAESYFSAAQSRMGSLLCRSGVTEAQCFFLAGAYLMANLEPVPAWRMFVQALACCQGFFLETATEPIHDSEWNAKQRIYWTCFKSELELRLELNFGQKSVLDLSYPTLFPSPPDQLRTKDEAAWYFYLAEIALRRLKNRILDTVYRHDNSSSKSDIENAILDFEEQTNGWLRSLPPALALHAVSQESDQYEPFRFILSGHLLDCQETMYWHFLVEGIQGRLNESNHYFVRKVLEVCIERITKNRKGFYHRHHGTWLMVRSCTRSALALLAAAQHNDLKGFLPLDWKKAVIDVTAMLNFWQDESRDVLEMLSMVELLLREEDSADCQ